MADQSSNVGDRHRRWRIALSALLVWLFAAGLLYWFLPIQPRLSLTARSKQALIGVSKGSRKLVTADVELSARSSGPSRHLVAIRAWNLTTGADEVFSIDESAHDQDESDKRECADGMMLAADGQTVAYYCIQGDSTVVSLRLFSLKKGREVLRLNGNYWGKGGFSPDGQWFAVRDPPSPAWMRQLKVFESSTGQEIGFPDRSLLSDTTGTFCFSPDSRFLAVTRRKNGEDEIQVWDVIARKKRASFAGEFSPIALSPDGNALAAATNSNVIKLFDIATGHERAKLNGAREEDRGCSALTFARDGQTLTAYYQTMLSENFFCVKTWDVTTGKLVRCFRGDLAVTDGRENPTPAVLRADDASGWKLLDVSTGKELGTGHRPYWAMLVDLDHKTLVIHETPEDGERGALWDWMHEHFPRIAHLAHSRSAQRLWNLTSNQELAKLRGYDGDCLITPDGLTFIAQKQFDDPTIDLFDLPPHKPVVRIAAWSIVPAVLVLLLGRWRATRLARICS